jgi:hypothetical protein
MPENTRSHTSSEKGKAAAHSAQSVKGKKGIAFSAPALAKKQRAANEKLQKPQLISRGNALGKQPGISEQPVQLQVLAPVGGAGATVAPTNVWFNDGIDAVDAYWTVAAGHKDDRTELMKTMAEKAGALGNAIKAATNDSYTRNKANKKTPMVDAKKVDDPYRPYDPVRVEISGTYGKPAKEDLTLDYHYGSRWHGYIIHVLDTGKALDDEMVAPKPGGLLGANQYSNRHEATVNAIIAGGDDADSPTKIAGEGARWQCIRAAAATLTDNTKIYSNDHIAGDFSERMHYVPFSVLWKTWEAAFAKKFDTSDAEVAAVLRPAKIATSAGNKDVGDAHSHEIKHGADINVDADKPASQPELIVRKASVLGFKKKNNSVVRSDKTMAQEETILETKMKGIKDLETTDLSGGYIGGNVFVALCAFPATETPALGDYDLVTNEELRKYPLYKHGKAVGKIKDLAKATASWKLLAKGADAYSEERKATYEAMVNRLAVALHEHSNGATVHSLKEYVRGKVPYPALITTPLPATPPLKTFLLKNDDGVTIDGFVPPAPVPPKKRNRGKGKRGVTG